MAYSQELAERIRAALAHLPNVEEKKMFGRLMFFVNGKMCLTAGPEQIMCRLNPELHEQKVKRKGCSTVIMRGRKYKGYIYVKEENLRTESDFKHWIDLALEFNEKLTAE